MAERAGIDESLTRIAELSRMGLRDAAESTCQELVRFAPQDARVWFQLGIVKLQSGALEEAERALRQALSLDPTNIEAWNILASLAFQHGTMEDVTACCRMAISHGDVTAGPWRLLGSALLRQGQWSDAANSFRRVLDSEPQNAQAWCYLAMAETQLRRFNPAQEAYERSLVLAPNDAITLTYFASMLVERGQSQKAVHLLRAALPVIESSVLAWLILGQAHSALADVPSTESAYRRALALSPQNEDALAGLANVLVGQWKLSEAESAVRQLLAAAPNSARGWAVLGEIQRARGDINDAIGSLRHSIMLERNVERHNMLLLSMQYADDASPQALLKAHCEWDSAYTRHLLPTQPFVRQPRRKEQTLRIGFISSDFRLHPIGFLALPALESLDRTQAEIICYTDRLPEDEYTARFRSAATAWRSMVGLTVEEVASQIRSDEIDILVDLMGHTGTGKTLFPCAYKPAPLQVTWLGYVGTTGMAAMDCLLADRFHVGPSEERWYSETVLRMPNDYACYGPPADAPDVGPLPCLSSGQFTFGSFSNPAKLSTHILLAWAKILQRLPTARLLLKYGGLEQSEVQTRVLAPFVAQGIAPDRILFEGWSPIAKLLEAYNRVDLALDTQPYSGGLTTCEALWMGVPVVTCPGKTFAGRHATSHLHNAGYGQFVADGLSGYIELAVQWANRTSDLALVRAKLRERVRRSPLCDAKQFARDFLSVLSDAFVSKNN